ncbi:esterase [Carbonactinospora thermoautotrophica]|uniref:patatin-like phospholipase family protein n=1 Tax=Carbonactinospora thermoautotrophica TaxID=1469144 RepID=UPI00226DF64F|nr:patatin-like phospholipase family protein [Carbonactinospora thermoautotrophica]MCX9191651.1 esterase [Carbonactinospora thermoautotrophica]
MNAAPRTARLGLALGGGAALGAAHAGVLQVLDEAGVECTVVAGTSAGALIGGGYAAGLTGAQLTDLVLSAGWSTFAQWRLSPRWGLLDTSPLERSIEQQVGARRIEELERRFGALAFDLRAREPVLLASGSLATALRASSAVPGLFPPVRVDDRLLVDGALADNLPVWAARQLGADLVIAVSVDNGAASRVTTRLLDTLIPARDRQRRDLRRAATPDVLIRPDTRGLSRWTASDVPRLVEAGRIAVESSLEDIYRLARAAQSRPLPEVRRMDQTTA